MGEKESIRQRVKHLLKAKLIIRQQKKYYRLLEEKAVTYDTWIREKEKNLGEELKNCGELGLSVRRISYEASRSYMVKQSVLKENADVILFVLEGGEEAELTELLITDFFITHPQIMMIYGDEDVVNPEGIRYTPWLKPDWSPDTFLSNFYFGSVFAVRVSALKELTAEEIEAFFEETAGDERIGIYRMCCQIARKSGGFERRTAADKANGFPVGHISEILFHSFLNREMELLYNSNILANEANGAEYGKMMSVIIPSKDNAAVLKKCIESIEDTVDIPCEIIVVDNGSEEKTREALTVYLKEKGYIYIYEKMPFHFSRMCNRGAEAASGEVLLFLNDDVEVPDAWSTDRETPAPAYKTEGQPDWLAQMYGQAVRRYAGAVGVKLLYPQSDTIQHAGIVNLRLGPVHKLQFKENNERYYYGWNRGNRNVIAVTGACLAVAKEKFIEAGGFSEELPVAFNDVDLCFTLYENGYYNTVLQDVTLQHHESLSRGQDEEKDKLERLINEKNKLYERHRALYARDPFYHKYLAGDMLSTDFDLKADYEWREDIPYVKLVRYGGGLQKDAREDACVMISLEYAGTVREWNRGAWIERRKNADCNNDEYYIQGYSFVTGSDNACYEKKLLLQSDKELFVAEPESLMRKDVEKNLPDQINVGMTGFNARIRAEDVCEGNYRIGILVRDRCSGQKLFSWTNRYLDIWPR